MGAANGHLLVGEIILPLRDIRVRDGMIWFVASKPGPVPATTAKFWVVIDEQGAVVVRAQSRVSWDAVPEGVPLTVTAPLELNDHEAEPGRDLPEALHKAVLGR